MGRFKVGDPVLVLPRFAHLFSINTGVVTGVNADPFRPMFNEYTLKLDDGTIVNVFEFQSIEERLKYQTFIAALIANCGFRIADLIERVRFAMPGARLEARPIQSAIPNPQSAISRSRAPPPSPNADQHARRH